MKIAKANAKMNSVNLDDDSSDEESEDEDDESETKKPAQAL